MSQSRPLKSHLYGDPLAVLELSRAEECGRELSHRELAEVGNRPLRESPQRATAQPNATERRPSVDAPSVIGRLEDAIHRIRNLDPALKASIICSLDQLREFFPVTERALPAT